MRIYGRFKGVTKKKQKKKKKKKKKKNMNFWEFFFTSFKVTQT